MVSTGVLSLHLRPTQTFFQSVAAPRYFGTDAQDKYKLENSWIQHFPQVSAVAPLQPVFPAFQVDNGLQPNTEYAPDEAALISPAYYRNLSLAQVQPHFAFISWALHAMSTPRCKIQVSGNWASQAIKPFHIFPCLQPLRLQTIRNREQCACDCRRVHCGVTRCDRTVEFLSPLQLENVG